LNISQNIDQIKMELTKQLGDPPEKQRIMKNSSA
jgi:hypothetical protein